MENACDPCPDWVFKIFLFITQQVYYLNNVDEIAAEFNIHVKQQPWAREVELTDPDGN